MRSAIALSAGRNPSALVALAALILVVTSKVGGCAHQQTAAMLAEVPPGYVAATATGRLSFKLSVSAPPEHALYLENCNGAINWGLVEATEPDDDPRWTVTRNQCLSPPIVIQAGKSQSFPLIIPQQDAAAPTEGAWRILLMGVFKSWKGDRPLSQPQVARENLISNPVMLGTIPPPSTQ